MAFPTNPFFAGQDTKESASVKKDDKKGKENGGWSALIETKCEEKGEVAEDERACSDVVTAAAPDEPGDHAPADCGGDGNGGKITPSEGQNGSSKNNQRDRVPEEVSPAIVKQRREEKAFEVRETAGMDAVGLERTPEDELIDGFNDPEDEDEESEVFQALPIGRGWGRIAGKGGRTHDHGEDESDLTACQKILAIDRRTSNVSL